MRKRDYISMIISFVALCFFGVIAITDSYIWHRIAFLMCTVGASMSFGVDFIEFVYYIATRGYKKRKGLGEEKSKREEPTTVANTDTHTASCENCDKKSSCKLQNKVHFSELIPKMIVCDEFTPTKTDFKYFTADQVRNMSMEEVREKFTAIMKSMKKW